MQIGIIGAGGRLGREIVQILENEGVGVTAVASHRCNWGALTKFHEYKSRAPATGLRPLLKELDAIICAAPLSSDDIHKEAITLGCHVVDVSIQLTVIKQLLALDTLARKKSRSVISMAGLAPGFTGLIGAEAIKQSPGADYVDVCLRQSANGTAGDRGTKDMLDLLTDRAQSRKSDCLIPTQNATQTVSVKAFQFPTPESDVLVDRARLRFYTVFDNRTLNTVIQTLGWIRTVASPLYRAARDQVAAQKAAAKRAAVEEALISTVAIDSEGNAISTRSFRLESDYGATAAISSFMAIYAASGNSPKGAGHMRAFVDVNTLLENKIIQRYLSELT